MKNYKTKGIVLKTFKLGEADKIITIITERNGKVAAVAKGVRRTKSRFGARLEPFTNLSLVIHKGRNLDTVTQAEIVKVYEGIVGDLEKINYGYAMLELVDKVTLEGEGDSRIYQMLSKALDFLTLVKDGKKIVLTTFDIKLLALTGFMPNVQECIVCSKKNGPFTKFSLSQGAVICDSCGTAGANNLQISHESIELMKKLLYAPFEDLKDLKTEVKTITDLDKLISAHIAYHLNIKLKVREFIGDGKVGKRSSTDKKREYSSL